MSAGSDNPTAADQDGVDVPRRRFLLGATTVVGAAGAAALGVQFLSSMAPSARALAAGAPVEADISKLEVGAQLNVEWRGKPVFIVDRTDEMMATLGQNDDRLKDPECKNAVQPDYARNQYRAREERKNLLVLVGICTHLSSFDIAGRVTSSSPAGTNLVVPPYALVSDGLVLIGSDEVAA